MTWSTWLNSVVAFPVTLFTGATGAGGTYTIQVVDSGGGVYSVVFSDGVNWDVRNLSWTNTGWVLITVEKEGGSLRVLENGVQLTFTPLADSTQTYGGATTWMSASICDGFDARIITDNISSGALLSYYDDIVNHEGEQGYLPILR